MVKIEIDEVDSGEMRTRIQAEDFLIDDLLALLGSVINIVDNTTETWDTKGLLYELKMTKREFENRVSCDGEQVDKSENDDEHELSMRIKDAIDKFMKEQMEA